MYDIWWDEVDKFVDMYDDDDDDENKFKERVDVYSMR